MEYYGTLGPGCQDPEILERMLQAGMTGLRLNLSHGTLAQQAPFLDAWKQVRFKTGSQADLLLDLEGPELRIGALPAPLDLPAGGTILLGQGGIPIPPALFPFLSPGQEIRLDDGKLLLQVEPHPAAESVPQTFSQTGAASQGSARASAAGPPLSVFCRILRGGRLSSRKSLSLPGCSLRLPILTEEDRKNLRQAAGAGVTGVMLPFVHGPEDLKALEEALAEAGVPHLRIFAKLEDQEALRRLPELVSLGHTLVIARRDLGNALKPWEIPRAQKEIARLCRQQNTPFLVVTQLLASMEQCPVPTRAEVLDIFNAVLDGASALMLTGETASGRYPVQAMEVLVKTGKEALRYRQGFTGR